VDKTIKKILDHLSLKVKSHINSKNKKVDNRWIKLWKAIRN